MALLAHISDLHFGREDPALAAGLLAALQEARPEVIVVSGDLTQRARKKQFRAARVFLRELPKVPRLVVPGNHDVSTTNLLERALRPLRRYRRYITEDLEPYVEAAGVAIAGINTVRIVATKDGRVNSRQVAEACRQLGGAAEGAVRVVVTHHPMDLPASDVKHALVTRAGAAIKAFQACRVDLFLSGHLHAGLAMTTAARYGGEWASVVAQAGTAISTRTRKEANGWNLITLAAGEIGVQQMVWGGTGFVRGKRRDFVRDAAGWSAVAGEEPTLTS